MGNSLMLYVYFNSKVIILSCTNIKILDAYIFKMLKNVNMNLEALVII